MYYPAIVTTEDDNTLAGFPDCPGCQTFARPGQDIVARAQEALEGWLESNLAHGDAPPRPSKARAPKGAHIVQVPIPPKLAVALSVRWGRQDADLTQAELAKRMGMSQQQAARLEDPEANPTIETLSRAAAALGADVELAIVSRQRPKPPRRENRRATRKAGA